MFCESYRETLSVAALGGKRLPAGVEAHLAECAPCGKSFSDEKALFALVDMEVRARVNADVPASLLPKIRQQIAAATVARTWRSPVLSYVTSALVISAIALSFAMRMKVSSVKLEPSARVVWLPAASDAGASQQGSASQEMLLFPKQRDYHSRRRATSKPEPEVLVSVEEQVALQHYATSLREAKAPVSATIQGNAAAGIKPLEIASVDLKQLSIEPLDGGDSN